MKSVLFFLGLALLSTNAFSADERGNGGDAVVCRNGSNEIVGAESLDHYEARTQLDIVISAGFPANSIIDAVLNVLNRIPNFDATRKGNYINWANKFLDEANFLQGIVLVDIPDSHHIAIPSGCEIEQLVVQRPASLPRQKRYTVNRDIWDRMDDASKVSVIVHEIIYREALELGHLNSINTRYLTARLLELSFTELTAAEYSEVIVLANFPVEEVCEQITYVTNFYDQPGSGFRISGTMKTELCYVAGSKENLSEGTVKVLLSKPLQLPKLITEVRVFSGRQNYRLSYDFSDYGAFEKVVGTKVTGYSGMFEVGTDCRAFFSNHRGTYPQDNCSPPFQ